MKHAFTDEEVQLAHHEIHDAAGRLFGWRNDEPEALRMAKRISGWARILEIGIEERQKIVTSSDDGPHTEND